MPSNAYGSDRLELPVAYAVERILRTTSDRLRALKSAGHSSAVRRVDPAIVQVSLDDSLKNRAAALRRMADDQALIARVVQALPASSPALAISASAIAATAGI